MLNRSGSRGGHEIRLKCRLGTPWPQLGIIVESSLQIISKLPPSLGGCWLLTAACCGGTTRLGGWVGGWVNGWVGGCSDPSGISSSSHSAASCGATLPTKKNRSYPREGGRGCSRPPTLFGPSGSRAPRPSDGPSPRAQQGTVASPPFKSKSSIEGKLSSKTKLTAPWAPAWPAARPWPRSPLAAGARAG